MLTVFISLLRYALRMIQIVILFHACTSTADIETKPSINAMYLPIAGHYAGIIAYEKYRKDMKSVSFSIQRVKNWETLKTQFLSGETDMAFTTAPLAIAMFSEKPFFRWVSLLHRNGSALAVNDQFLKTFTLADSRIQRKPTDALAIAIKEYQRQTQKPVPVSVPFIQSTQTLILYQYLMAHDLSLSLTNSDTSKAAVKTVVTSSVRSPFFLKRHNSRTEVAAFEQSLPWADVAEIKHYGKLAWYSKDILKWPNGHVDNLALAQDRTIRNKKAALKEVIYYLHQAGRDINNAQLKGAEALKVIAAMIRQHIPEHSEKAIIQSLSSDLNAISYTHLNIDEAGLQLIMDLSIEADIIQRRINITDFSNHAFSSNISAQP